MRLDIGCGQKKRVGHVGIDYIGNPDVLCDISREQLPFEDASVEHVFSSHCFEHIPNDRLLHVFKEITRVCADRARIEIWHPLVWHSDAFVLGHISLLSEAVYDHFACTHRDFWKENLGAAWMLREVRYNISGPVLEDLQRAGVSIEFAASYLRDVVHEIGIFATIHHIRSPKRRVYRRSACSGRGNVIAQLQDGPRR